MDSSESTVDFMMWILLVVIVLQLLAEGGGKFFVIWIRMLAYTLHLPLYRIVFPGNVSAFFELTLLIALFDFMENFEALSLYQDGLYDDDAEFEVLP